MVDMFLLWEDLDFESNGLKSALKKSIFCGHNRPCSGRLGGATSRGKIHNWNYCICSVSRYRGFPFQLHIRGRFAKCIFQDPKRLQQLSGEILPANDESAIRSVRLICWGMSENVWNKGENKLVLGDHLLTLTIST